VDRDSLTYDNPTARPARGGRRAALRDRRVEIGLGAAAVAVLAIIVGMLVTVLIRAWPSFSHNGLAWFGPGGDVDEQIHAMQTLQPLPGHGLLYFRAWPLIWGTILTTRKNSVSHVVQLEGANLTTATLILTVMILPIMVAITADALDAVPRAWQEGSLALGVNRWRTMWRVSLRTVRPAIIAATILATARALGEAVMLAMVAGSRGFAPNPLDGLTFFFEPVRPLAATILLNAEGLTNQAVMHTMYAIGAVLLVSAAMLSLTGWSVRRRLSRYGIRT
jgi:ABC-type phosphate transport system permease subunit